MSLGFRPLAPLTLLSLLQLTIASAAAQAPGGASPPVSRGSFDTFSLNVPSHVPQLRVVLQEVVGDDADLYIRRGAPPTLTSYDFKSARPGTSDEEIVIHATTTPPLTTETWHVGVLRPNGTVYDIQGFYDVVPASRSGMGANRWQDEDTQGTTFRVWAPNATAVHVASNFNGWSSTKASLASEGNGIWSLDYRDLPAGSEYKFVLTTPTGVLWRVDPRARQLTASNGNGIVVDPDSYTWASGDYGTPPWNDLVIYELHVGTFQDVPGGAPGNLGTATSRLDYLANLGVNAVELLPISEFAGDYSWGYNYSHPFSVESIYGGFAGLQSFVDEAHARGIAVLLDVLYNHWGPQDLDLWRFDGWSSGPWGGIYFYNDSRAETPWGDTRPDYGRGEVRQYIRDNVLFWLDECRVDGMRWDSTSNIRFDTWGSNPDGWSLMQWVNDEVNASQPWKIQIAEDMYNAPNPWITKDTGAGGAGFDAQWDAMFVHPVRGAVVGSGDDDRDMWAVRAAILQNYNGDAFERVIYTESHDEVANGKSRVPEEIWPGNADSWFSKKRSTLASTLVLTSPGIPMLFQGQEILEDGYFQDTDPVDWSKLVTFSGIHSLYRDLIRLRRNLDGVSEGLRGQNTNVQHVNNSDKVIAFHRWSQGGPGDDVIVLLNFRDKAWRDYRIGLPRAGTWKVRFNSDWDGYDAGFSNHPSNDVNTDDIAWDGMAQSASLSFGPYTAIILSQ